MRTRTRLLLLIAAVAASTPAAGRYAPRVKDVASLEGVRSNQLYGYGLVIGLNGTGDKRQTLFTSQTLKNLLERQGITLTGRSMKVTNVAGVIVTAKLSPFSRPGSPIDLNVASIGDCTSLRGGILLLTELQGADGEVYATAQGPLLVGGAFAQSAGGDSSEQINHPTVARIPAGGIVERASPGSFVRGRPLSWVLHRPDFATAQRLARTIESKLGPGSAEAVDARRVLVTATADKATDPVSVAAMVEGLELRGDGRPRVVVNERTGTIVAGLEVGIEPVSIAHGGLTIDVQSDDAIVPAAPFTRGRTVVVPQGDVALQERPAHGLQLGADATVGDLVRGLTALGASITDMISVLQLLREAGALQAELVIL